MHVLSLCSRLGHVSRVVLCTVLLAGCSASTSDDLAPSELASEAETSQAVSCNPTLTYYPVRGRHNHGYDSEAGNSSLWTCNDDRSRSDFSAGDHLGNDIWAAEGTPVVAARSGTATLVGYSSYSGNKVTIADSCGWYHFYTHLKAIAPGITNGKHVPAGTVIGYVGKSGSASNGVVHLHYSIYPAGNYNAGIDPWPYTLPVEHDVCNLPGTTPSSSRMQLVAHTTAGLYHSIRTNDGTWTDFGNIFGQTGTLAGISNIAEAGVGTDAHDLAIANDTLYHTIRRSNGTWTAWGSVESQTGSLTNVTAVAAAGIAGQLQVVTVANDTVYHTIRRTDGTWGSWGNVEAVTGQLANVTALAAGEVSGELHVLAVANDTLFHSIRRTNGTWTPWGNVEGESGFLTNLTAVAGTGVNGQLHVVVVAGDTVRHTVRGATWSPWGNVESQSGALTGLSSLAIADVAGQLQVVVVAGTAIMHAIRYGDGSWTDWGNVSSYVPGESGTPLHLAATGT